MRHKHFKNTRRRSGKNQGNVEIETLEEDCDIFDRPLRQPKKKVDKKKKKVYNKCKGEEMSSTNYARTFTMDNKLYDPTIYCENKLVCFIKKTGPANRYFLYDLGKSLMVGGEPSISWSKFPEEERDKIEDLYLYMKQCDFNLYFFEEEDKLTFYDMKINGNYLLLADFIELMEKFNINYAKPIDKGVFTTFLAIKDHIKTLGFNDGELMVRPLIELPDQSSTYYAGSPNKIVLARKSGVDGAAKDAAGTFQGNSTTENCRKDQQQETYRSNNGALTDEEVNRLLDGVGRGSDFGPFDPTNAVVLRDETLGSLEDLNDFQIPEDDVPDTKKIVEPWFTTTLVDEEGEIDDSSLKEYFNYFTSNDFIPEIKRYIVSNLDVVSVEFMFLINRLVSEFVCEKIIAQISKELFEMSMINDLLNFEQKLNNKLGYLSAKFTQSYIYPRLLDGDFVE